jgi:hypothetical protein
MTAPDDNREDTADLKRAIRHCRAAMKALEAARAGMAASGRVYPTHLYVAGVELAAATEIALAVGLRNQEPPQSSSSQKR